jgi:hypothetical protein
MGRDDRGLAGRRWRRKRCTDRKLVCFEALVLRPERWTGAHMLATLAYTLGTSAYTLAIAAPREVVVFPHGWRVCAASCKMKLLL